MIVMVKTNKLNSIYKKGVFIDIFIIKKCLILQINQVKN